MFGHTARRIEFGSATALDSERVGARPIEIIGGQRGIDAAAQEHPDRHVGHGLRRNHPAQQAVELFDRGVRRPHGDLGRRIPEPLDANPAVGPGQRMPRGQLGDPLIDGLRRGNVAVQQEIAHGAAIDGGLAQRQQRLKFGGECNSTAHQPVIQGLDAEPVASEQQAALFGIP